MGRKPRVQYEGALYHVIQRGNNREQIFAKNEDKVFFMAQLKKACEITNEELLAFAEGYVMAAIGKNIKITPSAVLKLLNKENK